jgi:hypothetical protein
MRQTEWAYHNRITPGFLDDFDLLLYLVQDMPGPQSSMNTYTCTCTRFCGGHKTGLSRATFYRHAPYRDASKPTSSFSLSFQNFLGNSAGNTDQEESQGYTDNSDFEIAGVSYVTMYLHDTEAFLGFRSMIWIWIWIWSLLG